MLELPECAAIAKQLGKTIKGKTIEKAVAAQSPHKFAWYDGDPKRYNTLLSGQKVTKVTASGGFIEVFTGDTQVLLGEGVAIRHHDGMNTVPVKHQLLLQFDDGSALVCTVQMYGAMYASRLGAFENRYYQVALDKPSPLTKRFGQKYFSEVFGSVSEKLNLKAFLATEQRIPGLGNGCLQDILFRARMNPQTKLSALDQNGVQVLYRAVVDVLTEMAEKGGRDTEKDIFGQPGGYKTIMSNKTVSAPCPGCGGAIEKKALLGGKVYFCPRCQPL